MSRDQEDFEGDTWWHHLDILYTLNVTVLKGCPKYPSLESDETCKFLQLLLKLLQQMGLHNSAKLC